MAKRKKRKPEKKPFQQKKTPKNEDALMRAAIEKAKREFKKEDLYLYLPGPDDEGVPLRQVIKKLEAIHRREKRKRA